MDRLDVKLWALAEKGQIVPDRSLLKTPEQIAEIRKSADLNTAVLDHVAAHIKAGMSTAQIDKLVYDFTTEHGGIPAPLGYEGFPKSVCTSINNVVCHGIPSENEILVEGDQCRCINHFKWILFRCISYVQDWKCVRKSRTDRACNTGVCRAWPKGSKAMGAFGRYCIRDQHACKEKWIFCCRGNWRTWNWS